MFKKLIPLIALLGSGGFLLTRPDSSVPSAPPKTVPNVDINKYGGTWYEIASIPLFWQRGCVNTKATYTPLDPKTVKVENSCFSNGRKNEVTGKAVADDNTGAKLQVSFPVTFGVPAPYWIVRLGKDYEYSVVSQPDYRYLWILSRTPTMSPELYNSIIQSLTKDGYPVDKLVKTAQNQPEVSNLKSFGNW